MQFYLLDIDNKIRIIVTSFLIDSIEQVVTKSINRFFHKKIDTGSNRKLL